MSVLSVSPSVAGGGAERVATSLHEAYVSRGMDSWLAVSNINADAPNLLQIQRDYGRNAWARQLLKPAWALDAPDVPRNGAASSLSRILRVMAEPQRWARVARGHEDFDFPWTAHLLELPPRRPDVLHLHNLHGGYFDIRQLPALSRQVPTVLTLHDTWLLTGHCAQPFDCSRWREGCGKCPDLDRYVPIRADNSAENCAVKRRAAALGSMLGIAAPSKWLLDMVSDAGLLGEGREGRVIPNGVDTRVFSPGDRDAARTELGLPANKRIVLVAAKGVRDNPYKGFDTLEAALAGLPERLRRDIQLVALGGDGLPSQVGGVEALGVPFVTNEERMASYYRAADVFVHPSRAEVFGLAVVEAMACGTAVVVSDAGGLPEIVEHGSTGLVFGAGVAPELATQLAFMFEDEQMQARLGREANKRATVHYSIDRQVVSYLDWYTQLLNEHARAGESAR